MAIEVEFPAWSEMVNPPFAGLLDNKDRYILMWGGRGSGKTDSTQKKIIVRMLTANYFKGILVRKVYDTIKESQYEGIKNEIYSMGLESLFKFTVSPLSIACINGNRVIARGLDKAEKIKGVDNPTFVWYEEGNDMTEEDFNTVTTTVRSNKADYLQEIFSFNPEAETPNFNDFWIYKKFFSHTNEKNFRSTISVEVEIKGLKKVVDYSYTSIHSTYKDNPHLPPVTKATYEDFKRTSPYYYKVYTLGLWGNKEVGNRFYKTFEMSHVDKTAYCSWLPLHISLDENVNPYLTMTIHQAETLEGVTEIRQIAEICLPNPRNTLRTTCEEFSKQFAEHKEGLYIYGDRTSKKQDTKLEKGENFFTLASNYLAKFRPSERLPTRNPGVKSRGEFINQIFAGNIKDAKIVIGEDCTNSVADYLYLKEAADGLKFKEKTTDKASKVRFEKYGHCSDANDYLYCEIFRPQFDRFIRGGIIKKPIFGSRKPKKRF